MSSIPSYGSWLPPEPPERRWPPWTAWVAIVVAFALAIFGAVTIGIVAAIFGASFDDPPPAVNIVATFVQDAAFVGAALIFMQRAGRIVPAQLGFVRTRLWPAVGWMALAYVGYGLLSQLWAQLVTVTKEDRLPESLGVEESTAALVAVCVLVTVVAPLAEETLFRGYVFGALRNWRGPWPAALLTGAVFGAIHVGSAPVEYLVPLAILGTALCIVRWQTGSLLPCIALHAANNAVAFGVAERWPASAVALLVGGAVAVTLLACAPFIRPRPAPVGV